MIGMKDFPDKFFQLALVDPPYGINATKMSMGTNLNKDDGYKRDVSTAQKIRKGRLNSGGGHMAGRNLTTMNCDWDDAPPSQEYFNELFRISVNQIIFGGNYFTDKLPASRCWICWDKIQPWENFSQFELAWTSFDKPARMYKLSNRGGANDEDKIHPTQKPISLYTKILQDYANIGDKILDTHVGSGSSRIAADKMGMEFTGFERDKIFFESQEKRFLKFKTQLRLF